MSNPVLMRVDGYEWEVVGVSSAPGLGVWLERWECEPPPRREPFVVLREEWETLEQSLPRRVIHEVRLIGGEEITTDPCLKCGEAGILPYDRLMGYEVRICTGCQGTGRVQARVEP